MMGGKRRMTMTAMAAKAGLSKFSIPSWRASGLCLKATVIVFLGVCVMVAWSTFSSSFTDPARRSSFNDIPSSSSASDLATSITKQKKKKNVTRAPLPSPPPPPTKISHFGSSIEGNIDLLEPPLKSKPTAKEKGRVQVPKTEEEKEESNDDSEEEEDDDDVRSNKKKKKLRKKANLPLFDEKEKYSWDLCNVASKLNYVPCIDFVDESRRKKKNIHMRRHSERSCPKQAPTCLAPLPEGYQVPVPWPESVSKVWRKNVDQPELGAYLKKSKWLKADGEYIYFPQNQRKFDNRYIDWIQEMVPDIEWGKNIRLILDIGCSDASFGIVLLEKEVLTLTLGLKDDSADLAQLALERGIPAILGILATRRLPFPSNVFDAIHCGVCGVHWHLYSGKLLLEMNRILRPGGYFFMSTRNEGVETSEAISKFTATICWSILAHKTADGSETGVRIYQKPTSNDIYKLRRRSIPICDEDENPDAAWYTSIKDCLNTLPAAIEQRGTEWPEEWPRRLETFTEWLAYSQVNYQADLEHWKSVVSKSYLEGLGVDWAKVRNVMDMKAIYGGLAAALSSQKIWAMNVVPVSAPDTLAIIFERGLLGIYHDWCEPFSTYPRSYDLLHADHLFSHLKNRCKGIGVVVEMDRILRPGGWVIIRDKVEILNHLETIFRTLHWDIRMSFFQDTEGIMCSQKSTWRP